VATESRGVVVAVILGGIAAAVAVALVSSRTPVYTASAAVAVDQPLLVATGSDLEVDKLSRIRVKYGRSSPPTPCSARSPRSWGYRPASCGPA